VDQIERDRANTKFGALKTKSVRTKSQCCNNTATVKMNPRTNLMHTRRAKPELEARNAVTNSALVMLAGGDASWDMMAEPAELAGGAGASPSEQLAALQASDDEKATETTSKQQE